MYTKKEKKQIDKSRRIIVKDIRNIWKMYPYEDITVPVNLRMPEYGSYWKLIINKKEIVIKSNDGAFTRLYPRTISRNREDGYEAHSQFISQYEDVREDILRIVNSRVSNQEQHIKKLSSVSDKFIQPKEEKRKEDVIEIDMPNSLNAKEIEITEEDNKKIGTIDFGTHTIKIITEGNIVLVNKPKEEAKVKRK